MENSQPTIGEAPPPGRIPVPPCTRGALLLVGPGLAFKKLPPPRTLALADPIRVPVRLSLHLWELLMQEDRHTQVGETRLLRAEGWLGGLRPLPSVFPIYTRVG